MVFMRCMSWRIIGVMRHAPLGVGADPFAVTGAVKSQEPAGFGHAAVVRTGILRI